MPGVQQDSIRGLKGAVASASRSAGSEHVSSTSVGAMKLGIVQTFGGRPKSMPASQTLAFPLKHGDEGDRLTVMGESPDAPRINNLFAVSSLVGDKGGCVGHLSSTQHHKHVLLARMLQRQDKWGRGPRHPLSSLLCSPKSPSKYLLGRLFYYTKELNVRR